MILFVRLAIVVNVLLVEGSPLYLDDYDVEDALQLDNLFDYEENNQGPSDEDTSALIEEIMRKSEKLLTTNNPMKSVDKIRNEVETNSENSINMVVPALPADGHGNKILIQYIYKGPVFHYNNYKRDDINSWKLIAKDNNAISVLKAENHQNFKSVETKIIRSFFDELSKKFDFNKYFAQCLKKIGFGGEVVLKQKDEYINQDVSVERGGIILKEITALIEEIVTKSDKLSTTKYPKKFVEEIRNKIGIEIENTINYIQEKYQMTDWENPELDEIWIKQVISDLVNMKEVLNYLLKNNNLEEKGVVKHKDKNISILANERNSLLEIEPSREISELIEDILRKSEKLLTKNFPMKSLGIIRDEVEIKIENSINYIQKNYQLTDKPNSESDETWINQAMTYLIEMNQVLDYLVTKINADISKDFIDTNRGIILDETKSSKVISILVQDILRKSDKLSTAKYPMKPYEEIRDEVELKIQNILLDAEKNFKFREKDNPELDEIWIIKAIAYLIDMNKDLYHLIKKNGLEDNGENGGILLNEIVGPP